MPPATILPRYAVVEATERIPIIEPIPDIEDSSIIQPIPIQPIPIQSIPIHPIPIQPVPIQPIPIQPTPIV
jgi:hypothetical protein